MDPERNHEIIIGFILPEENPIMGLALRRFQWKKDHDLRAYFLYHFLSSGLSLVTKRPLEEEIARELPSTSKKFLCQELSAGRKMDPCVFYLVFKDPSTGSQDNA